MKIDGKKKVHREIMNNKNLSKAKDARQKKKPYSILIEIINVGLFIINGCSLKHWARTHNYLKFYGAYTTTRQKANPTRKALV